MAEDAAQDARAHGDTRRRRGSRPRRQDRLAPPGKRADLILVRTGAPHLGATGDPYDALVQLAQPSDIDTVVADGRILRRKGEFTALDYGKLLADATQSVETLKAKGKWT